MVRLWYLGLVRSVAEFFAILWADWFDVFVVSFTCCLDKFNRVLKLAPIGCHMLE